MPIRELMRLPLSITGRRRALLRVMTAAILGAFVVLSWAPFRLDPPRFWESAIVVDPAGMWMIEGPSLALTDGPPEWLEPALHAQDLIIDLRIRPAVADQDGPARILALSPAGPQDDLVQQNLVIGQEGADLVIRIRRPGSDALGQPPLIATGAMVPDRWSDIRLRVGERVGLEVDGEQRERIDAAGWPTVWQPDAVLSIGNTPSGNRPWRGDIGVATVASGDLRQDLLRDEVLEVQERMWVVPSRLTVDRNRPALQVIIVGLVHLVMGAVLLVAVGVTFPGLKVRTMLIAVVASSIVVNAGKIVIATRHPSVLTVLLQSVGGVVGVLALSLLPGADGPGAEEHKSDGAAT